MDKNRVKELSTLQDVINIRFKDLSLLNTAFIHPSVTNEREKPYKENNQRLEFLGDAVLELVVSEYLYRKHPDLTEGQMTKVRAFSVCEPSLAQISKKLFLGDYLILGKGEENTRGREKDSILADTLESLIGAIYIDKGMVLVRKFVIENIEPIIHRALEGEQIIDYKTNLQEILQKTDSGKIIYKTVRETGPDHDKRFYVEVFFNDEMLGKGIGRSKKQAEQKAAKQALKIIKDLKI